MAYFIIHKAKLPFMADKDTAKLNPETVLREGRAVSISPRGYSMYPLLIPEKDRVVIEPLGGIRLKKRDIALFRRKGSKLVLHRIVMIKKDEAGRRLYYFCGDNQKEIEGPVYEEDICGVVTRIEKRKLKFSVRNPLYILSVFVWMKFRPIRPNISRVLARFKKAF